MGVGSDHAILTHEMLSLSLIALTFYQLKLQQDAMLTDLYFTLLQNASVVICEVFSCDIALNLGSAAAMRPGLCVSMGSSVAV